MLGAAHPKELPFEALIGLLEEREENSPCHAAKAQPEVLPGALSFKEVEEDVNRVEDGCCPFKVVFDEDLYVVFDEDFYVLSMYLCFALSMS